VSHILKNKQRLIKENLFSLSLTDIVLIRTFAGIALIPFRTTKKWMTVNVDVTAIFGIT